MKMPEPVHKSECPGIEVLSKLVAGKLPESLLTSVGRHLETCAICTKALSSCETTADPLLVRLRQAASEEIFSAEEEASIVELAKAVGQDALQRMESAIKTSDLPSPDVLPKTIGPYEVLAELGRGGMGVVYKARQPLLDRPVAVKVIAHRRLANPQAAARFRREMKAVGLVQHPNIVVAHDAGAVEDMDYLVMEYVFGCDAAALIRRGRLPIPAACEIVRQAALGLEHAHRAGLVHRDIKPSNLMVTEGGQVKVLDLGLAQLQGAGEVDALTATGHLVGTLDYMAPEQFHDGHRLDGRADIYSLGCTLYQLLCGQSPFGGPEYAGAAQKIGAHLHAPAPPLKAGCPEASGELAAILDRMLAKNPAERFATAADLARALEPFTAGHSLAELPAHLRAMPDADETSSADTNPYLSSASVQTQSAVRPRLPGAKPPPRRRASRWLTAAAGGFFALLLGVIVILKNEKGQEIGRLTLPEGQTAEIQQSPPAASASGASPRSTPQPTTSPPAAVAPFDAKQARAHQEAWARYLDTDVETTNSIGMTMILIPPGEFMMGSTDEQIEKIRRLPGMHDDKPEQEGRHIEAEQPQHRVVLTAPFRFGATEVTIGQFKQFVEKTSYKTAAEISGGSTIGSKTSERNPDHSWRTPGYAVTDLSPVTQLGIPGFEWLR
jgi:serine/threonine protein kinase